MELFLDDNNKEQVIDYIAIPTTASIGKTENERKYYGSGNASKRRNFTGRIVIEVASPVVVVVVFLPSTWPSSKSSS